LDHVASQHAHGVALDPGEAGDALEALSAWADRTTSGDRGELPDLPDDSPLWREVSSTAETRLGPRCPFFERCFVTRARRAAQGADLVIVNHHLFFADLALRDRWPTAQLLPAYEAVIFDEAHQIEDVATDYFGVTVSSLRLARLQHDVTLAVSLSHLDERGAEAARHVGACADDLFSALRPRLPRDARATASDDLWSGEPTRAWRDLDTALEALEALAGSTPTDTTEAAERCAALARRARSVRDDLALIADRTDRGKV